MWLGYAFSLGRCSQGMPSRRLSSSAALGPSEAHNHPALSKSSRILTTCYTKHSQYLLGYLGPPGNLVKTHGTDEIGKKGGETDEYFRAWPENEFCGVMLFAENWLGYVSLRSVGRQSLIPVIKSPWERDTGFGGARKCMDTVRKLNPFAP